MNKNLLPIGSVVELKNSTRKVFISGFKIKKDGDSSEIYDYIGYPYPQGFSDRNFNLLFNHEQIKNICYLGYVTQDEEIFKQTLYNSIKNEEGF